MAPNDPPDPSGDLGDQQPADDDIGLPDLLLLLCQHYGVRCSYSKLWASVVQGTVPAYRIGQSWRVKESNVPRIAEVLRRRSSARPSAA